MTASKHSEREACDSAALEPTSVGRYLIFDEIGVGGMASVHLGLLSGAAGFQRMVAIKRLHSRFARDPSFRAQFLDEARLAARIRHPNVAQTLDVLWTGDELLLVLEYLDGDTLGQVLKSLKAADALVPIEVAAGLMAGVLHGLHAAHLARDGQGQPLNVVHRDVSPQNLLIGRDGQVRVLDFGIAKAKARGDQTEAGVIKGKFGYVAPEQVRCAPVDARTDVYSAGIVLWELLTGQRLFPPTRQVDKVLERITLGQIPRPSSQRSEVPAELDEIVLKATAKLPEQRFQSAEDFAVALEQTFKTANVRELKAWFEPWASEQLAWRAERIEAIERAYGSIEVPITRALEDAVIQRHSLPARTPARSELTQVTRQDVAPAATRETQEDHASVIPALAQAERPIPSTGLQPLVPLLDSSANPFRPAWSSRSKAGVVLATGLAALVGVTLGWRPSEPSGTAAPVHTDSHASQSLDGARVMTGPVSERAPVPPEAPVPTGSAVLVEPNALPAASLAPHAAGPKPAMTPLMPSSGVSASGTGQPTTGRSAPRAVDLDIRTSR